VRQARQGINVVVFDSRVWDLLGKAAYEHQPWRRNRCKEHGFDHNESTIIESFYAHHVDETVARASEINQGHGRASESPKETNIAFTMREARSEDSLPKNDTSTTG
jgi:hypothetical protein